MDASGAAPGPVTGAVFKTVCGAMLSSWVGSTPMPLRQCVLQGVCVHWWHGVRWSRSDQSPQLVSDWRPCRQSTCFSDSFSTRPTWPRDSPLLLLGYPAGDGRARSWRRPPISARGVPAMCWDGRRCEPAARRGCGGVRESGAYRRRSSSPLSKPPRMCSGTRDLATPRHLRSHPRSGDRVAWDAVPSSPDVIGLRPPRLLRLCAAW